MVKAALFGAVAFALVGSCTVTQSGFGVTQASAQELLVVTESSIVRLRTALRLSPAQQVHWRALESTLRSLGQRAHADESEGLIQRVRARIRAYAFDAQAVHRIAAAARPLIASLDDDQKREGMAAVRELGVGAMF